MDQPNNLFLIGGADLEMFTIKQLLTANEFTEGKNLADHHLTWDAKLSDYQNLFNDSQTFTGIELVQDIIPPLHYISKHAYCFISSLKWPLPISITWLRKSQPLKQRKQYPF